MYAFIDSLVLPKQANPRWIVQDISQMSMQNLLDSFVEAYIGVQPQGGNVYYTKLSSLFANSYPIPLTQTLEFWLMNLPTSFGLIKYSNTRPTVSTRTILFSDAFRSGYLPTRIPNSLTAIGTPEPRGSLTDLLVSKTGVNLDAVQQNCIWSVNGLLHTSLEIPGTGIRIIGGGKTNDIANRNQLGIISFRNIGTIQQIPFTLGMVSKPDPTMQYRNEAYINLGVPLTGKSVCLSLGGYLHINDSVYEVINYETGLIKIRLKNVGLLARLFESQGIMDLSSMGFTKHPYDAQAINYDDLSNDSIVVNYFLLPQTFAIVVNTPSLYGSYNLVERSNLNGRFYDRSEPIWPLTLRSGVIAEYTVTLEDDTYVLGVQDSMAPSYQYTTTDWQNDTWLIPNLVNSAPYQWSQGQYLEIGSETVTTD